MEDRTERVLLGGQQHVRDMEKRGRVFMVITCWRYGESWQSSYGDLVLEFVEE